MSGSEMSDAFSVFISRSDNEFINQILAINILIGRGYNGYLSNSFRDTIWIMFWKRRVWNKEAEDVIGRYV